MLQIRSELEYFQRWNTIISLGTAASIQFIAGDKTVRSGVQLMMSLNRRVRIYHAAKPERKGGKAQDPEMKSIIEDHDQCKTDTI